ncbi:acyl carrier protein [Derxia lacustris]|uniref:acyl carrier protein n=1 Tax=Derxia lacustris TaxID=764842 RepID=UPI000A16EC5B|nr:acyl carrier protein [Derxia lacustris]
MNLSSPDLATSLRSLLADLLGRELRIPPHEVDPARALTSYGLDSIAALTVSGELEERLGLELEPTLLWDCPTIDAIADHLAGHLAARAA